MMPTDEQARITVHGMGNHMRTLCGKPLGDPVIQDDRVTLMGSAMTCKACLAALDAARGKAGE